MAQMGQQQGQGQQQQGGQQNQQQQGQMSGQGVQFSDQDVLQLALNETKMMASSLNTYILEASDDQLRRDYMTVLGDVYSQQKQIFDVMQQKGYYNVQSASPQSISQVKNKFNGSQQSGGQGSQSSQGNQQMQ
ncbi:coat F domain-containing protein [Sporomusaceae bacterium FL31]|nr:coat F domain-containing protein [Sporomusaceae bacterium FL31]GCE33063.1 coat F domain-containing protein [Sporomusaceae bacterium]